MDRSTLQRKSVDDLREIARQLDLTGIGRLRKAELIDTIIGELDDEEADADGGDGDRGSGAPARDRDEVIERRRTRNRDRDDTGRDGGGDADGDADASDDEDDERQDRRGGNGRDGGGRARSRDRRQRRGRSGGEDDDRDEREGVLDLLPEGYGFLRTTGYVSGERDVYVSQSYVRRFNLRRGDLLGGPVRFNKGNDKFPALARLETCEGEVVDNEHDPLLRDRPDFAELDAVYPDEQLELAGDGGPVLLRALDAFAPIGLGQRALVLAPPTTDTGALVRAVAAAVAEDDPDLDVFVMLVDARPEEIHECERRLPDHVEVVGSPLDAPPEDHVAAAELVVERAKRLAERGRDAVVLLDSLTQLGRAYNLAGSSSGRTLPGGIDTGAIGPLKQLFGAARNLDGEGSLTLLAVAGVDADSDTDRTILDHLRGAGNAEWRLDPTLGTEGDLPGLDVQRSGTRRSEALVGDDVAEAASAARVALRGLDRAAAWQLVVEQLGEGASLEALADAARAASD